MSSPTHASSSIDHYSLLQPPSPRDDPMEGTPPSDHLPFRDIEPVDYMSYGETLQCVMIQPPFFIFHPKPFPLLYSGV